MVPGTLSLFFHVQIQFKRLLVRACLRHIIHHLPLVGNCSIHVSHFRTRGRNVNLRAAPLLPRGRSNQNPLEHTPPRVRQCINLLSAPPDTCQQLQNDHATLPASRQMSAKIDVVAPDSWQECVNNHIAPTDIAIVNQCANSLTCSFA